MIISNEFWNGRRPPLLNVDAIPFDIVDSRKSGAWLLIIGLLGSAYAMVVDKKGSQDPGEVLALIIGVGFCTWLMAPFPARHAPPFSLGDRVSQPMATRALALGGCPELSSVHWTGLVHPVRLDDIRWPDLARANLDRRVMAGDRWPESGQFAQPREGPV